ncbi:MAG: GDYXXLXY domain-containing protein [Rhodospirillales bacterium]|nr:GDYXXLXY domain-containing protein [Rhodospirillales bacterium]MCB9996882.1 GDYXXLXY domain-containing protein [Rhodospirillales bacterium]
MTYIMTDIKKTVLSIFVLVLPMLVLGGMWAKTAMKRDHGQQVWQIRMTGYDPRDLLYGHYLRFRYDWNMGETRDVKGKGPYCMCLTQADETFRNPAAIPTQCRQAVQASCASVIKVQKHGRNYSLNPTESSEKYFIPEEKAKQIDRLFRKAELPFYMEIMAHEDNSVAVRGIYVEDQTLEEYLRTHPEDDEQDGSTP